MTVYVVAKTSAPQSRPGAAQAGQPGSSLPAGSTMVELHGGAGSTEGGLISALSAQLIVRGTGTVSARAFLIWSLDGLHWLELRMGGQSKSILEAAAEAPAQAGIQHLPHSARFISAVVSHLAGDDAEATVLVNA